MQGTHDSDETRTANDGEGLDLRDAARVLVQAERDAKRQFNLGPPWITAAMGGLILVGYGALWLSTLGQNPYSGPSLGAIALVYGGVAVSIAVSVLAYRRATVGVSGPSVRQRQAEGVAILVSFIGSPVLQSAMKLAGASDGIVYGVIPAAGPLIIVGTTVLGIAVGRADWPQFGAALTVVIGGVVAAFVGPSAAWLAAGIGLFVAVAGYAVTTGWLLGRS
jgi:hypothetical protein